MSAADWLILSAWLFACAAFGWMGYQIGRGVERRFCLQYCQPRETTDDD